MKGRDGAALLFAILIMVMVVVIVTGMAWRYSTFTHSTNLVLVRAKAMSVTMIAVNKAIDILSSDETRISKDGAFHETAISSPDPEIKVRVLYRDAQGRVNINNFAFNKEESDKQINILQKLILLLKLPSPLGESIIDWIDFDNTPRPFGAEDEVYMRLPVPYLTANRPLILLSEIHLVAGVDSEKYSVLANHVTALPEQTALSVNAATAEALAATLYPLSLPHAKTVVDSRNRFPFEDIDEFFQRARIPDTPALRKLITLNPRYYEAQIFIMVDSVTIRLNGLIKVNSEKEKGGIVFLYRS